MKSLFVLTTFSILILGCSGMVSSTLPFSPGDTIIQISGENPVDPNALKKKCQSERSSVYRVVDVKGDWIKLKSAFRSELATWKMLRDDRRWAICPPK